MCNTPTATFGNTADGLVYDMRLHQDTVDLIAFYRAKLSTKAKGAKSLCNAKEKELSQFLGAELGLAKGSLYSNRFGLHACAPMDILHTVPHGIVELCKEILLAFAGASTWCAQCLHFAYFFVVIF